jgi:hypothetical protein
MFVTNEQVSRAVDLTPNVMHTALNDVTTFLHNSHQQLRFVITTSLDHSVAAINKDLDSEYQAIDSHGETHETLPWPLKSCFM